MVEYIDREALLLRIDCYGTNKFGMLDEDIRAFIKAQPAADVAPVVRCKDCKYWQDNNDGYPHEECRWGHGETPDANDFCSYGERKEGADNGT